MSLVLHQIFPANFSNEKIIFTANILCGLDNLPSESVLGVCFGSLCLKNTFLPAREALTKKLNTYLA
jgi:hypothetical protein